MKAISRFLRLTFGFVLATALSANAQSLKQFLLALSKRDRTLAIVDASSLRVVGKVPVGEDPHEVAVSADGKTAYVSIYGGGSLHTINVIDIPAQKRQEDIDTYPLLGPHGLFFTGNKLWFTTEGSKTIGSYDPSKKSIDWVMGTGQDRTHMIYVTRNAKKIYTTNVASGTVSILQDTLVRMGNMPPPPGQGIPGNMPPPPGNSPPGNPMQGRRNWEQTLITVSKGSEGFDVSPDSTELWTASAEDGRIFIINLSSKQIIATLDAKVNGANRLKFTPDGRWVFISSLGSGELTVYDARSRKEFRKIETGHGAAGIEMQPDSSRAFVACTPDNYIAVIDLKTLTLVQKLDVGAGPDGMAWDVRVIR